MLSFCRLVLIHCAPNIFIILCYCVTWVISTLCAFCNELQHWNKCYWMNEYHFTTWCQIMSFRQNFSKLQRNVYTWLVSVDVERHQAWAGIQSPTYALFSTSIVRRTKDFGFNSCLFWLLLLANVSVHKIPYKTHSFFCSFSFKEETKPHVRFIYTDYLYDVFIENWRTRLSLLFLESVMYFLNKPPALLLTILKKRLLCIASKFLQTRLLLLECLSRGRERS